jgi:hypothetical protein
MQYLRLKNYHILFCNKTVLSLIRGYQYVRTWTKNFGEDDRQRRPTSLASSFTGHNTTALLHVGLRQEHSLRITRAGTDDLKKRIIDTIMTIHDDMLFRTRRA